MSGALASVALLVLGTGAGASLRHGSSDAASSSLSLSPSANAAVAAAPSFQQASPGVKYTADVTSREGLGDNMPYPSVDYLGVGYDVFRGNPDGDKDSQLDPGFRNSVIQLRWSQDEVHQTRDLRFLQPVGGYAFPAYSCHQASNSREMSTSSDYQQSLGIEASLEGAVEGAFVGGSFQASAGFEAFNKEVASKQSERFEMVSYCLQFTAGFDQEGSAHQLPTAHFSDVVKSLPKTAESDEDEKTWLRFFTEFGTHYISHLDLGGKMVFQMTIDRSSMEKLRSSSVDVSAAVEAKYSTLTGSASAKTSSSTESAKSLSSANTETKTMVLGGLPPESSGSDESAFGAWASTVREAPMPVKYKLTALSALKGVHAATYDAMLEKYAAFTLSNRAKSIAAGPTKPKSGLLPGFVLEAGSSLAARHGAVSLQLTTNGELVLSDSHGNHLWKNAHHAGNGAKLEYTKQGNLVVRASDGSVSWQTGTQMDNCGGKPPGKLAVLENGNVAITSATGDLMWSTRTSGMKKVQGHPSGWFEAGCPPLLVIKPGGQLHQGQRLVSSDQRSYLELTDRGRLNLYGDGQLLWHNHVAESSGSPFVAKFHKDGGFDVRTASDELVWFALSGKGVCHNTPKALKIADDGHLVIVDKFWVWTWATDSEIGQSGVSLSNERGVVWGGCNRHK